MIKDPCGPDPPSPLKSFNLMSPRFALPLSQLINLSLNAFFYGDLRLGYFIATFTATVGFPLCVGTLLGYTWGSSAKRGSPKLSLDLCTSSPLLSFLPPALSGQRKESEARFALPLHWPDLTLSQSVRLYPPHSRKQ